MTEYDLATYLAYMALGDHTVTVTAVVSDVLDLSSNEHTSLQVNIIYYSLLDEILRSMPRESQSTRRYGLLDRN